MSRFFSKGGGVAAAEEAKSFARLLCRRWARSGEGGGGVLKKDATRRRRANNKRFSPTAEFPRKLLTEVRRQIQKYFVMETRPWEIKYRDEEDEVARPPHTTDFFFRKEGIRNNQSRINRKRFPSDGRTNWLRCIANEKPNRFQFRNSITRGQEWGGSRLLERILSRPTRN